MLSLPIKLRHYVCLLYQNFEKLKIGVRKTIFQSVVQNTLNRNFVLPKNKKQIAPNPEVLSRDLYLITENYIFHKTRLIALRTQDDWQQSLTILLSRTNWPTVDSTRDERNPKSSYQKISEKLVEFNTKSFSARTEWSWTCGTKYTFIWATIQKAACGPSDN